MTTHYIERENLERLVKERDDYEKRWWFLHPSSQDDPPKPYELGHNWASKTASWRDLRDVSLALHAIENIKRQPVSIMNDALGPFYTAAAKAELLDARKRYQELSEEEWISLRFFILGAYAVVTLVIQQSQWASVGIAGHG